jgi:hypothetical protein
MSCHINHITKLEFLLAFKAAFNQSFTEVNIRSAFRGVGLVPLQPEAVLSRLDIQLPRTPSPDLPVVAWEARTPSNQREVEAQSTLIRERIRRHKSSSPAHMLEALNQLEKGAQGMVMEMELMRDRITKLEKANQAASQRKKRKRRYIKHRGTLNIGEGADILAQREATKQIERERRATAAQSDQSRHCGRCREPGHNARTCLQATISTA